MRNIHKRHRLQKFSVSEHRLCFDNNEEQAQPAYEYDPDANTGQNPNASPTEIINSNEQQRPYWKSIEHSITRGIRLNGSPKLQKIWESKELREWIMAQVERNPVDGRFTFLPPNARGYAEEFEGTDETRINGFVEINNDISTAVDNFVTSMDSAIDVLEKARNEDTKKELPTGVDPDKLIGYLQKMKDKDVMKGKQHALVALQKDILSGITDAQKLKKQINATLKGNKEFMGTELHEAAQKALNETLNADSPGTLQSKKNKMLDQILTLGILGFDSGDRVKIQTAINTLGKATADEGELVDSVLIDVLADQTTYLRTIVGDDNLDVIRNGVREDTAYSVNNFVKSVRVIKPDMTPEQEEELRKRVNPATAVLDDKKVEIAVNAFGFKDDLATAQALGLAGKIAIAPAKAWAKRALQTMLTEGRTAAKNDPAGAIYFAYLKKKGGITPDAVCNALLDAWDTKNVEDYMSKNLNLNDEVGFSIKAMMLRAKMPDDVAEFLTKSGAKIRISDLTKLSEIKHLTNGGTQFTDKAADSIVDLLAEEEGGKQKLEKDRFVETMAFLLVDKQAGGTEIGNLENATKLANVLWVDLLDGSFISDKGDILDKPSVLRAIQKLRVGNLSLEMHAQMNKAELYELTWADNSKRYFSEFVEEATEGVGSWIDYIKNLSALAYTTQDPLIKESLKHRDRLNAIKKALESALETSDESKKMLVDSQKAIEKLNAETKRLSKPLDATSKITDSIEQGRYLAEANAHVINILRSENLWDDLPNDVRQTSLWIAMNIGNGDPKIGILEAKKFLRAYHSAPKALKFYEDAFNVYMGSESQTAGQTQENLVNYLDALQTYQAMAGLEDTLYSQYVASINAYHNALMMTPDIMIGKTIKAVNTAGNTIEGILKSVESNTGNSYTVILTVGGNEVKATYDFGAFLAVIQKNTKASHEAAANAYRAAANEHESKKDPRDPASTAYNEFLQAYLNGNVGGLAALTKEQRTHLLRYRRKIETVVEINGRSNLHAMFRSHGIFVKPGALMAIAESRTKPKVSGREFPEVSLTNGSYGVDNWLTQGHREFADEPLRIVLGGPEEAKKALIKAYINNRNETYFGKNELGVVEEMTVTAEQAFLHVSEVKRLIQWQSEQQHPALEELGEDELFKDPIEGGFRATIESLQDMWSGDGVDKAKVVAAVVASIWLIRHIWKEGGKDGASGFMKLLKYSIVGLPLLMVANSAYKNRTGRDILGEKLLYMSKPKRDGILEQWRRRSAKYSPDRYGVLNHPAGFAAMQELMRKNDPVSIHDLHKWRMSVKDDGTGYNNYLNGMPSNINVFNIQMRLGGNATKEEAAKVAFMTYEALCTDVAAMHGQTSGDVQNRANWGADYIYREYYLASSYSDVASGPGAGSPTLQDKIRGRNPGMMDVMIAEAQLPSLTNSVQLEETVIERLASFLGVSTEFVKKKLVQGYTQLEILALRGKESIPDWWQGASELVFETADEVAIWLRVRGIVGGKIIADNFWASIQAIKGLGITLMETAPGVLEFVFDGAVDISSAGLGKLKETHDALLLHEGLVGEISLLKQFEEFVLSAVGYDFLKELQDNEAKRQIKTNTAQYASLLNGGAYSPVDGKNKYTISRAYPGERSRSIVFGEFAGSNFVETSFDDSEKRILEHMNVISGKIFKKKTEELTPGQQRFVMEVLQANMYRNIANHPALGLAVVKYNKALNVARSKLKAEMDALTLLQPHIANLVKDHAELGLDVDILFEKSVGEITQLLESEVKEYETLKNIEVQHTDSDAEINAELNNVANPPSTGRMLYLNADLASLKVRQKRNKDLQTEKGKRIEKIYIYTKIAKQIDIADRKKFAHYDTKVSSQLKDEEMGSYTMRGQVLKLTTTKAFAATMLDETIKEVEKYLDLGDQIEVAKNKHKDSIELIQQLNIDVKKLESEGVSQANIETSDLYRDVDDATILTHGKDVRSSQLLHDVFKEEGSLFGISLVSIFGEAGEIAEGNIKDWIQRRLENDTLYKKYMESGKDVEVTLAYQRYLANIGVNETFLRSMIRNKGYGEKQSPLHLSFEEGHKMNEYLEERERMVSFAKFLEIWEPLSTEDRKTYLP